MQQQKNSQSSRLPGTGGRAYRKAALLRDGRIEAGKSGAYKVLIMRGETPVYGALLAGFDLFSAIILARITGMAADAMGKLRLGWPSRGGGGGMPLRREIYIKFQKRLFDGDLWMTS